MFELTRISTTVRGDIGLETPARYACLHDVRSPERIMCYLREHAEQKGLRAGPALYGQGPVTIPRRMRPVGPVVERIPQAGEVRNLVAPLEAHFAHHGRGLPTLGERFAELGVRDDPYAMQQGVPVASHEPVGVRS